MLRTYKALLHDDKLKWMDDVPVDLRKEEDALVYVTILDEHDHEEAAQNGSLVDFFLNSPLYGSQIDLAREIDLSS